MAVDLLPGNPAISGGDVAATIFTGDNDQCGDGFPREIDNNIDIGAFELGPPS